MVRSWCPCIIALLLSSLYVQCSSLSQPFHLLRAIKVTTPGGSFFPTSRQHASWSSSTLVTTTERRRDTSNNSNKRRSSTMHQSSNRNDANNDNNASSLEGVIPRVYPQRWVQLVYLSLLALLSDWICFGVAAVPSTFESLYPGYSAESLVDIFLFTNVVSCFIVTDTVRQIGLEKAIKGAAILMSLGCIFRSGLEPLGIFIQQLLQQVSVFIPSAEATTSTAASLSTTSLLAQIAPTSFPFIVAGTIMVGAAQPFFQCTPPLLSAIWFGPEERATSTAVALNFNQIGIATAFLVGGNMAADPSGLVSYFALISLVCIAVTIGTILQFVDKPAIPPSCSELEKVLKNEKEPPFFETVQRLFSTKGFTRPLLAFICSISITNVVGTFIDDVLERGGIHGQLSIDLAGAGFELAILVGGILIGGFVDRTKKYKAVTLFCLAASIFFIFPLGLKDHALGEEPLLVIASLLGLGMAVGPVQPINAELAVDVTYPSDETAVESVQQIGGNFVSALLVPLAAIAAEQDYELFPSQRIFESDIRGDVILMAFVATATLIYFNGFDAPLRRTIADADCGKK